MEGEARIPLSVPVFIGRERELLAECIDQRWVAAGGPFVARFQEAFAERHGLRAAVGTVNGTAALHVALAALRIGPGDEVIVPSLTFVATANPVRYLGAEPVFCDVDRSTYTLDVESVRASITDATRAIVVVHLYGHPADLDPLLELAREHGLPVIEDATEALGSSYRGRPCGTLADIGCFSFNGNKVMTTGGGGMVLAADDELRERIRYLTLQAREPGPEYVHGDVGFNYAMTNVQAALGLAQLEHLDELLARRRQIAARYREGLAGVADLEVCGEAEWAHSNFWLNSVLIDESVAGRTPHGVMAALQERRIESRPFFYPLHLLPPYRRDGFELPVSEHLHRVGLCIPSSADLDEASQARVIEALTAVS